MPVLADYQNGNCRIVIFDDGTKTRSWPDGEVACVVTPESIDLKITDYCDAGCAFCHESSTKRGEIASLHEILRVLKGLPAGTEIAIGGGNPLSHPNIYDILVACCKQGLIANLTVNALHINSSTIRFINMCRQKEILYGVGISYHPECKDALALIVDNNSIVHVIAGVHSVHEILKLPASYKILVLGYKNYGFGSKYLLTKPVNFILGAWQYHLTRFLTNRRLICFDNLALEQLNVKGLLSPEQWQTHYMGDDGKFTMYCDCVKRCYAASSTQKRIPYGDADIVEMFRLLL